MGEEDFLRLKHASHFISIDMAHALQPNFKEKYDVKNAPRLGDGIVVKFNANQRYATTGLSGAQIVKLCEEQKIPHQSFASHANMPCGSTIGALAASRTGIQTVDIGLPQLSMHAARELIAIDDHRQLCRLLKSILES